MREVDLNILTFNNSNKDKEELPINIMARKFKEQKLLSGNQFKTEEELLKYIKTHYGVEGINRFTIAKFVLQKKKFIATHDVLLTIASTSPAKIILATAGAGKTTTLQLDIIVSKLIDKICNRNLYAPTKIGDTGISISKILFLNYNRHNAKPASDKHKTFVSEINSVVQDCEKISDDIESSTAHAFCRKWLERFKDKLGLDQIKVIDPNTKSKILTAVIEPRWSKYYDTSLPHNIYNDIDSLYNYKEESMLDWDTFFQSAKFIDSDLNPEFVKNCILKYESMKRTLKVFDFIDFIKEFLRLMKNDEDFRNTVTKRYSLIIADEAQDFTAIMNEILYVMQTANNRIIAVGDTDQTIYSFRGVSPANILSLANNLNNSEVLTLDTNYRCPAKIVEAAKAILKLNKLRFDKEIRYIKPGGTISKKSYTTEREKYKFLLTTLSNMSDYELENTVIAFRNNESSFILAEELFYAGIPYNLKDTNKPFNSDIFSRIYNILDALYLKDDIDLNLQLWQILPVSKTIWTDIIEYNKSLRISDLHYFVFDNFNLPDTFFQVFSTIKQISSSINDIGCSQYIHKIFDYFKLYYYNFLYNVLPGVQEQQKKKQEFAALCLDRTLKFFNRDINFKQAKSEFIRSQKTSPDAVTLSTIHALKGLEFDTVIAVDMVDSIFPNYERIETLYPENTAMEEKEAENRLCYVLLTRAKEKLILMYDALNPSVYLQFIQDASINTINLDDAIIQEKSISVPSDISSKLKYIKRIMGR